MHILCKITFVLRTKADILVFEAKDEVEIPSVVSVYKAVHKAMQSESLLFKHLLPTSMSYEMWHPVTLTTMNP